MIGGEFGKAFEFFRLARYNCLHQIPRLQQVMPTALSSDTKAWTAQTGYCARAPYSCFASLFPRRRSTGPGRVVDEVEPSSVRLTPPHSSEESGIFCKSR
jgi:hypothetical protein